MTFFLIIALFVLLLVSVPIFAAVSLATAAAMLLFTDTNPLIMVQRLFGGIDRFTLMSMPFFILAANAMDVGGLSSRILRWARALVGHISGGVAMTTHVASMFFGSLSGSSPATVIAIGKIMYPELLRQGYAKHFASGLITSTGSISLIIPPSLTLIIYATVTNTSVGALFMAGLTAGIVFGCIGLFYIWIYAKMNNLPRQEKATRAELWTSTKTASWALMVPLIILGGIYLGVFTATEAAGVSAVYAIVVGMFVYKEIDLKKLYQLCLSSAITSAQVMILVAAASMFGWLLTVGQVPQSLAHFLTENFTTEWTFLLFLNILLLIVGMFMEGTSAIVILAPLLYPTAVQMGIDPVHLGVLIITNMAIGMYTPPFGLNIFVANSITKMKLVESVPGLTRFLVVSLVALLIITYIPQISTLLPDIVYGS
ncbi:TRAP transporter large permease [Brevibacillus humidisoli]|uniref:TRAP transporter large permease n=1 Tax=Brevibacillus humidisoli TaxID=2895522 RepID=UPI001E298A28|nr:TRAP transporter large permease [Brevibacillus humidisoli]UFJ41789.1 TRAP transporter large permease [Brevibacillus humidisoli]